MKITINNKSLHDVLIDVEGIRINLNAKEKCSAEIFDTRVVKISVSHTYRSHVDAALNYILVADSEYTVGGITDGAELIITHSRTGFRSNGVYERFYVYSPAAAQSAEKHTISNAEYLLKSFNDRKKSDRRFDVFYDYFIGPLLDFGFFDLLFFGVAFAVFCREKGFLTALLYGVGLVFLLFAVNAALTFLINLLFPQKKRKKKSKRKKKKRTPLENFLREYREIDDLEEHLSGEAMINALCDPDRFVYKDVDVFEG